MVRFPFAKINLGLNVVRRRDDGYSDIESVLVPIALYDALEVVVDQRMERNGIVLVRTGIAVPGSEKDDICYRAVQQIQAKVSLPGLRVHLHKAIPIGAGLGGGSSDAAHMLLLLNDLFSLGLSISSMAAMAAELGSDCPFFLKPEVQFAQGRGELLSPLSMDLKGLWMVLVNPGIHISTGEVYRNTVPSGRRIDITTLLKANLGSWRGTLSNDMEDHVFASHPVIRHIKTELLHNGALYASMSGSGSSVFGIFQEKPSLPPFTEEWSTWTMLLD